MSIVPVVFMRKSEFPLTRTSVAKSVRITKDAFERMLKKPSESFQILKDNQEFMYHDGNGVWHCLLVTGEEHRDGLLVMTEGSEYVRYGAYVPDAAAFQYDSLSELGARLAYLVEDMVSEGTSYTSEGNWLVEFGEIEEKSGLKISENPFLQELLADMIAERPEVEEVIVKEDCFDVFYYLDYCPNCEQEGDVQEQSDELKMEIGG